MVLVLFVVFLITEHFTLNPKLNTKTTFIPDIWSILKFGACMCPLCVTCGTCTSLRKKKTLEYAVQCCHGNVLKGFIIFHFSCIQY